MFRWDNPLLTPNQDRGTYNIVIVLKKTNSQKGGPGICVITSIELLEKWLPGLA